MSIEKIKSTFQSTELMPENKGSKSKIDGEGLLEDRESDSEFDPEQEKKAVQMWDDEEDFITADQNNEALSEHEEGEQEIED